MEEGDPASGNASNRLVDVTKFLATCRLAKAQVSTRMEAPLS